jgi:hypothetical protein
MYGGHFVSDATVSSTSAAHSHMLLFQRVLFNFNWGGAVLQFELGASLLLGRSSTA